MVNDEVGARLRALDEAGVAEVAEIVLTKRLGADDLKQASEQLAVELGLRHEEAATLAAEALAAADADADTAVALLRIGLAEAAAEDDAMRADVLSAADAAGRKQLVIGPEWLGLGVLLVLGYAAVRGGGRQKQTDRTTFETDKDGRLKVTRETEVVYINPFSSLGKLVQRLLGLPERGEASD